MSWFHKPKTMLIDLTMMSTLSNMSNAFEDYSLETSVISAWNSLEIFTLNDNNLTTLGEVDIMPNLRLLYVACC